MYEGTVRLLMEYGATTMEHLEHLKTGTVFGVRFSFLVADAPTVGEGASNDSFEKVVDPLLTEEYEVRPSSSALPLMRRLTTHSTR